MGVIKPRKFNIASPTGGLAGTAGRMSAQARGANNAAAHAFIQTGGSQPGAASRGGASVGDPFWDDVSLMLKFEDGDGSRVVSDSSQYNYGLTMNGTGNEVTTDFSQFGEGSYKSTPISELFVDTKGATSNMDAFDMGDGDFTVEGWFRATARSGFFDWLFGWGDANPAPDQIQWGVLYSSSDNRLGAMVNTAPSNTVYWADMNTEIGSIGADFFTTTDWRHIHLTREGSKLFLGVDGNAKELTTSLTGALYDPRDGGFGVGPHITGIGAGPAGGATGTYFGGWVDEFRVTKGVARYTGLEYDVPIAEFEVG
jgi:hypothetical protein